MALTWVPGPPIPEPHFSASPRQSAVSAVGTATHPRGAAGFSTCALAALLQAVPSYSMLLWRHETTTSTFTASGICSSLAVWASCCPLVPRLTTRFHLELGPGSAVTSCASMSRRSWALWAQEGPLSAVSVPAERDLESGAWNMNPSQNAKRPPGFFQAVRCGAFPGTKDKLCFSRTCCLP